MLWTLSATTTKKCKTPFEYFSLQVQLWDKVWNFIKQLRLEDRKYTKTQTERDGGRVGTRWIKEKHSRIRGIHNHDIIVIGFHRC